MRFLDRYATTSSPRSPGTPEPGASPSSPPALRRMHFGTRTSTTQPSLGWWARIGWWVKRCATSFVALDGRWLDFCTTITGWPVAVEIPSVTSPLVQSSGPSTRPPSTRGSIRRQLAQRITANFLHPYRITPGVSFQFSRALRNAPDPSYRLGQ